VHHTTTTTTIKTLISVAYTITTIPLTYEFELSLPKIQR
jgi:hypothetical protein